MNQINLVILKDDLINCKYVDSKNCPIAKALKRANFENVLVGGYGYMYFSIKGIDYSVVDQKLQDMVKKRMPSLKETYKIYPETFTYLLEY